MCYNGKAFRGFSEFSCFCHQVTKCLLKETTNLIDKTKEYKTQHISTTNLHSTNANWQLQRDIEENFIKALYKFYKYDSQLFTLMET